MSEADASLPRLSGNRGKATPPRATLATTLLVGLAVGTPALGATPPPPSIQKQPGVQVLQVGQRAGFLVAATNATHYQWSVSSPNGGSPRAIPGATNAFLLTAPVGAGENGETYSVAVSGPGGTTTSTAAPLYIGPNADGSPPDSLWGNPSSLPKASQVLTASFVDLSFGRVPASQMFWSLSYRNAAGKQVKETHSFAEAPVFDMPKIGGTRLYVYVAQNAAQIGTGATSYYDFLELNVGQDAHDGPYWINMDTTRVDRWGLPVAFRLQCGDGTLKTRGDDLGVFAEDRQVTLLKYQAELGGSWAAAAAKTLPYGINEPGGSGFGKNGPYAGYYTNYVNQVWAADGLTIPKPTNFLDLATQLPDLSAALNRHVALSPGSFRANGTLADKSFWKNNPPARFYQHEPANLYSAHWHEYAIGHLQYGFPYDDDDSQSSDVGCKKPQTLVIAVGL